MKWTKIVVVSSLFALVLTGCLNNATPESAAANQVTNQNQSNVGTNQNIPWIASKNTTRINTDDLIQQTILVSQTIWMATNVNNKPNGVILVDVSNWQYALAAADLIHHPINGPILFINKENIPDATLNEIKRLQPQGLMSNQGTQAVLVGAFDAKVLEQLNGLNIKTDAITGAHAADIAKNIDEYYAKASGELPQSVVIGSMEQIEYTLPAVNWIAHMPEPLLYASKNEIPKETIEALQKRNSNANIYLLGPENVISTDVETKLAAYGKVIRIAGGTPTENSIAFAKYKDPQTDFGWGITTPGHNFSFVGTKNVDSALAAAPFSHLGKHSPLLITEKDKMPDALMTYIMSVQPKFKTSPTEGPYNHAWIIGSQETITRSAQGEIDNMLEIVSTSGAGHGGHDANQPSPPAQNEHSTH